MFVQVFQGRVRDPKVYERQTEQWRREIRPKTTSFLGFTAGLTDDGEMITIARFDSEPGARRDSDLPEQGAWFEEFSKNCDVITFHDCPEVDTVLDGGSNDAGFVQVMRGRVLDAAKMDELSSRLKEFETAMAGHRPDVIGDVTVVHTDGSYTDAVYFTSEAEARQNEGKEPPPETRPMFEEWMAAATVDEYFDLKQPRLV
jgi:hypothetical protein